MVCFGRGSLNVSAGRTEGGEDSGTRCTTFQVIEGITNLTSVEDDLITNQEDTILFGETKTINQGQFFCIGSNSSIQNTELNNLVLVGVEVPILLEVLENVLTETNSPSL